MYHQMHKLEPGQSVLLLPFDWVGSKIAHFRSPRILGMLASCLELQYHVILFFSHPFLFYMSLLPLNFHFIRIKYNINLARVSLLASGKPL